VVYVYISLTSNFH